MDSRNPSLKKTLEVLLSTFLQITFCRWHRVFVGSTMRQFPLNVHAKNLEINLSKLIPNVGQAAEVPATPGSGSPLTITTKPSQKRMTSC